MALTARLQFGDNDNEIYSKEYLVVDWQAHYMRNHNGIRPDSEAVCESIDIVLIAPDKQDLNLYAWFIDNSELSGRFIFEGFENTNDRSDDTETVLFENAMCYSLAEEYSIDDRKRRLLRLKITPEEVKFGVHTFKNVLK